MPAFLNILLICFLLFISSTTSQKNNTALTCLIEPIKIPVPGASPIIPHPLWAEWMSNFIMSPAGADFLPCNYPLSNDVAKSCLVTGKDLTGLGCPTVWAGLESPFNSTDYQKAPDAQMYPIHGEAVVPLYNLGYTMEPDLILSPQVLADIFTCNVTNWRDPEIIALNSGPQQLCPGGDVNSTSCLIPDARILVFAQPGPQIVNEIFSRAMYTWSATWRASSGPPSQFWPTAFAMKCGMPTPLPPLASAIIQKYSITYATYAQYLTSVAGRYARMINRDGYIVAANTSFVRTAMNNGNWNWTTLTANLIDTPGNSWPINYLYYAGMRKNATDCGGSRGAINFFSWALQDPRCTVRTEESGYAYLSPNLTQMIIGRMKSEIYCARSGIPAFISFKLNIGVLLPQTGYSDPIQIETWREMIEYGVATLNAGGFSSTKGMRTWKLFLEYSDSTNTQSEALIEATSLINKGVKTVIGEFSDLLTNTVQVVFAGVSLCQLSPQTQSERPPTLLDSSQLIRMREAATSQSSPILATIKKIGWSQMTILFTTDDSSVLISARILQEAQMKNVSVQRIALTTVKDSTFIKGELTKILDSGLRVIVSCIPEENLEYILGLAEQVGIVGVGYTWIFVLQEDPIEEKPIIGENWVLNEKLEGAFYFSMKNGRETEQYNNVVSDILNLSSTAYPALVQKVNETKELDEMMISIYDLVTTLGTGLGNIIQNLTDFEVEEHDFHELCSVIREQVKVTGLRGDIQFNGQGDGMLDYIVWNFQKQTTTTPTTRRRERNQNNNDNGDKRSEVNNNDNNGNNGNNNNEIQLKWIQTGSYESFEDNLILEKSTILSGGNLESPPEDYIAPVEEVVKFEMGNPLTTAAIVFTVVGELVVIYFMVEVSHFEKRKVFRAASLFFLRIVLLGAAIGFGANLMVVLPVDRASCIFYTWLSWIAFTLVFGGLYAKTYRIWRIFTNSKLEVLQLSDAKLLRTTLAIFSINGLLLILWQSIDTPYVTTTGHYYASGKTAEYCTSSNETIWLTLYLIPFFGLLIGLSFVSFRIRNLQSKFNESKQLALAIYHFTFCFIISLSLSIALHQFLEFQAAVRFFGIWFGELGLLVVIYSPKIWICYSDPAGSDTVTLDSLNTNSPNSRTFSNPNTTTRQTYSSKHSDF